MFLEMLAFLLLGCAAGIIMGLLPGVHPNLILLLVPLFMAVNAEPVLMLVFIVAMAVVNSMVDAIPSILLGAPDSGSELAVLPGHKMLMNGNGYAAVRLTVTGSFGAMLLCIALMPLIVFLVPNAYALLRPYMHVMLIAFVTLMLLSEKKKLVALCCFLMAGIIGILSSSLPIDRNLVLFPIFSGFFGMSMLILQLKNKTKPPEQSLDAAPVSKKTKTRSVLTGTLGGIFSGLLPGVGSSQIAAFASIDNNDHSFLMKMGAITTANVILSLMALWLISNPRSGVAMVVDQLMEIGFNEFLVMIAASVAACAIGAMATLAIAKRFVKILQKADYTKISASVLAFIVALIFLFTGVYGLFLAGMCCSLGIAVNLSGIRRGNLMGVLIVPTVLFFIGF